MTNSKKLILISILELLIANAYGVEVDRGAAAVSALLSIAMVMTLSILAFQLIAYKITRKTIATPIENGRWIGAWFASLAIASSGNFYDGLTAEYFYRLSLITIPLLLVGFVIGFAWKKFRGNTNKKNDKKISSNANIDERLWEQADAELNSDNRKSGLWAKSYSEAQGDESKAKALYLSYRASELQYENTDEEVVVVNKNSSSTNKTTIQKFISNGGVVLVLIALIAIQYLTSNTATQYTQSNNTKKADAVSNTAKPKKSTNGIYKAYACKDPAPPWAEGECDDRFMKFSAKFKADKQTQQVFAEYTELKNNSVKLIKLPDCSVIDENNWVCGDKPSINHIGNTEIIMSGGSFQMSDGVLTNTKLVTSKYTNGNLVEKFYVSKLNFIAD